MRNIEQFLELDQIVVVVFLLITSLIGLWVGRGIKNYTIAHKSYDRPSTLFTMFIGWVSFLIILALGITLGYITYTFYIGTPQISKDFETIYLTLCILLISASLIGLIFARRKKVDNDDRLEAMQLMAGTMAHEVKSPLAVINISAQHLQIIRDSMVKVDINDQTATLTMEKKIYESLSRTIDALYKTSNQGLETINTLLTSLKNNVIAEDKNYYPIRELIESSLEVYNPTEQQLKNLTLKINDDFTFYGSMYYMRHVLLNLLSNAYKYGGKDVKITITTQAHKLYFKDYGKGISSKIMPHIFKRFYTANSNGTGIGLAFCKMVMDDMNGKITCKSEIDKYTEFTLTFLRAPISAKIKAIENNA